MSLEAIAAASAATLAPPATGASTAAIAQMPAIETPALIGGVPQPSHAFESVLDGLNQLNGELNGVQEGLQQIAAGNLDNLHQSMMGMEKARLALQLLLQVRSRALDAYQELMRMQV
jgi:flagellar hook-basal body complex protein FliE